MKTTASVRITCSLCSLCSEQLELHYDHYALTSENIIEDAKTSEWGFVDGKFYCNSCASACKQAASIGGLL